jgi:hypothetical protein
MILKVRTIIFVEYVYHNFLKFSDFKQILKQIMKIAQCCYRIDVILKALATTFPFRDNGK